MRDEYVLYNSETGSRYIVDTYFKCHAEAERLNRDHQTNAYLVQQFQASTMR